MLGRLAGGGVDRQRPGVGQHPVADEVQRKQPSRIQRVRDLVNRGRERRLAQSQVPILGQVPHAVEGVAHLVLETAANVVAAPEQPAEVLHPLEVRDRDPAGIREDVREYRDPALGEDRVRLQ